ncbi:cyanobactin maturation protease PatG family protein [Streptomyces sp. NPDC001260]|uniref:cyanobactin maturation protease PatG family protein n=1 Tax=Streptomyces sp. NPDC001260 TaxID=3364551 RepID=UPI003698D672
MESETGLAMAGACPSCAASATAQRADAYAQPAEDLVSSPYVYAIGRIEARFPRLSVEKEFAQVSGRSDSAGLTDTQLLQSVLSEHRYLARLMCWVLLVREIESYILLPQDSMELQLLVDAVRPDPSLLDLDVVIGRRGPMASPDTCNGLTVPLVAVDQIYSFDRELFRRSIPKPDSVPDEQFQAVTAKVLDLILQVADNAGATEDHRALNYLAMRYPEIYKRTARAFDEDFSLSGVHVQRSSLGGARTVVDCIFTYTHRSTGFTEKAAASVDVTDELPFLVTPLSTYYDRFSTS